MSTAPTPEPVTELAARILRENMTDHDQLVKAALVLDQKVEALAKAQRAVDAQKKHLADLWTKWDPRHPVDALS